MKKNGLGAVLIALAVLLLAGCDKPERQEAAPGSIRANAAFREHFGEPPLPAQGTCYARVGYYPLASDPAMVRAVPLFLFRESGQLSLLLERLLDPGWDFPPHSNLHNPFPPGSSAQVTKQAGDSVTIDLTFPSVEAGEGDLAVMIAPLVETALQFQELERVFITVGGSPLAAMPAEGFRREARRLAPVGPPLPLMVVGSWTEGEPNPEEVLVNFDRPVTIVDFRLTDRAGREIKGEYYRAGFDMAVVVHPAEPHALQEGIELTVAWNATDRLGRTSSGEQIFTLQRYEHEH
jgi:germination protein M